MHQAEMSAADVQESFVPDRNAGVPVPAPISSCTLRALFLFEPVPQSMGNGRCATPCISPEMLIKRAAQHQTRGKMFMEQLCAAHHIGNDIKRK
jgi:hypothetical protein